VDTIRREGVKTIFAESSVDPKVEQAIASEAGAEVGAELWADTLGPEGSDGATYVQSIESNTQALVTGFTGGEQTCSLRS
jgi:zinc/manganese transport system substrate-binding protein